MATASRVHPGLSGILERLGEGEGAGMVAALDPRDADQRGAIEAFLELAGKDRDRYPALYAGLEGGAPAAALTPGELRIVDAGRARSGRATACAWHAPEGGAYLSGAVTLALDAQSRELLGFGSGTQVGGSLSRAGVDPGSAGEAGEAVTAFSFFHSQRSPAEPPRFGVAAATRPTLAGTGLDGEPAGIEILPKDPESTKHPVVKIAVARTELQEPHACDDVDYCYREQTPLPNPENPLLLVPFTGSAQNLPPIQGIDPTTKQIAGLVVSTALYANCSAQSVINLNYVGTPTDHVTAEASGTGLSWSFPFDGGPQATTKSLRYGPVTQYNEADFAFVFSFEVPVSSPRTSKVTFSVCSEESPVEPSETCRKIKKLWFVWHCLAVGTPVVLEDGSEKPIEEVTNADRVRTADGGSLGVEATTLGAHRDGEGPLGAVYRLLTERGRELILSALHPVITPDGPVAAQDLEPGRELLGADGRDAVRSCERTGYEGNLVNLVLVKSCDRARGLAPPFGSFLAGGIAVGDYTAQADHYRALRHDLDYMSERLPEANLRDYESALADVAAGR